jgi:hypothetical protein
MGEDFVWAADLLHATAVHHNNAVGYFKRFFLIVRHKNARDVIAVVQFAQPPP